MGLPNPGPLVVCPKANVGVAVVVCPNPAAVEEICLNVAVGDACIKPFIP